MEHSLEKIYPLWRGQWQNQLKSEIIPLIRYQNLIQSSNHSSLLINIFTKKKL